ncbi:MAG: NADH-quinone oxidoreductase subunit NuoK [Campylobacteraceae bacterium]|jgi:NADH-quinone oxidoreductase subunit K|nr:NADH-quinone oxidoreductase subunit NuoK [Campylobacteraceae bacterium]
MIGIGHYLALSGVLFAIGILGVLRRKSLLMLFFATEILLNAANVGFVAISKFYADINGQIFALFIIAIAASEVAVGLGLLVLWYKRTGTIDLDSLNIMKG